MPTTCPHCAASGDADYIRRRDCCTAALADLAERLDAEGERAERFRSILEDVDAAIATLYIGRDHGITPQADGALRDVVIRLRDATYTSDTLREVWTEARPSWLRGGKALPVETINARLLSALRGVCGMTADNSMDALRTARIVIADAEGAQS